MNNKDEEIIDCYMSVRIQLLILLLSGSIFSYGQKKNEKDTSDYLVQPNRIEFEVGKYDLDFHVISGKEDGMMVVQETSVPSDNGYGWVLTCLDTTLNVTWQKLAVIPSQYSYTGFDYNQDYYYLLFMKLSYTPEDLIIYQVDRHSGTINTYELSTVFPIYLTHFEVIGETVLLAGTTNYRPAVLTYDLDDRNPRVIPGIYNGNNQLVDITVDDDAGIFSVIMKEEILNRVVSISVKTFTTENIMIQNNLVNPGEELGRHNLIDGASTNFEGGFQYIAGTYSNRSFQYSRGLYLSKFVNGRQQFIRYINYADLENFFGYMREKRQQRIKERIERRRSKGKKVKFSYRLLVHDIIRRDDHYILIAEAYYPRYTNTQQLAAYGVTSPRLTEIVGYKYTHAIIVAFDQNGNMLWDHSFEIDDVYTYNLREYVTVNVNKDRIELCYLEKNLIRSKLIMNDKVVEGKSYTPLRLGSDKDVIKTRDPDVERLDKWYGDTMYAYGEQTIQHTMNENRISRNRDVFYINKVRYNLESTPK